MSFHIFDLSKVDQAQVREVLTSMGKEGLKGGIYVWINKTNGNTYVGSSIDLRSRLSDYFGLERLHGIIGRALLKYGLVSFILILVFVPNATREMVLSLEQSVLDNYTCVYYILQTAGSLAGFKHTEEAKAKVSAARKGKSHSDETKAKISAAKKGKNLSDGHKAKIAAKKSKAVYLYVVHPHGLELSAVYLNTPRASENLGIPRTTLSRYIQNRTLFKVNGISHVVSWGCNLT
jgi:group I intron endonuclease